MKQVFSLVLVVILAVLSSCSKEEALDPTPVAPEFEGTFTDSRDGNVYRFVRYAGLDWMAENARYQLTETALCTIYQDPDTYYEASNGTLSTRNLAKYGCLYTLEGALQAAPSGWRLPTDADWQTLERAMGMSNNDASARDWRSLVAERFLAYDGHPTPIAILLGGYHTQHVTMGASGWRFKGVQGYYWTQTRDEQKAGSYYFYRRFRYNNPGIYRESMEPVANQLSVRYVRDAQ